MIYTGVLRQDKEALRLAEDVRRGMYRDDSDLFLIDLESWYRDKVSKAIREVSIYESGDRESDGVTVYMRCLDAVGVNVEQEAEHIRQVMRDAIAKSKRG
jgi:hypothetical protein